MVVAPCSVVLDVEAVEAVLDRTGQLAADVVVVVGEHGQAEVGGPAQHRPGLRRVGDRERHQRGLEAHRRERAGGEADQVVVHPGRDGDDAAGEGAERLAQARCGSRSWLVVRLVTVMQGLLSGCRSGAVDGRAVGVQPVGVRGRVVVAGVEDVQAAAPWCRRARSAPGAA